MRDHHNRAAATSLICALGAGGLLAVAVALAGPNALLGDLINATTTGLRTSLLIGLGVVLALGAVVAGHRARRQIRRAAGQRGGVLALVGLLLGYLLLIAIVFLGGLAELVRWLAEVFWGG